MTDRSPPRRRWPAVVGFGLAGGLLVALLEWLRYRFLLVDPSAELFAALTAVLFAAVGLWLGRSLRRRRVEVVERLVPLPAGAAFVRDEERLRELGLTPREMEILAVVAEGLSNREIAARLHVSENTVKTHLASLYSKLGARRRTEAVRLARAWRLIP